MSRSGCCAAARRQTSWANCPTSTGTGASSAPPSARASVSRSSTSRLMRADSASMSPSASARSASVACGFARRKPALARIVVNGVRSSCEASAVKRCWAASIRAVRRCACSSRSSIALKLPVTRPRSSLRWGGGSRRVRSGERPTSSAVWVSSRSGRSARRVTSQMANPAAISVTIDETISSATMPRRSLARRRTGCAATTNPSRSARWNGCTRTRTGTPSICTVADAPPAARAWSSSALGRLGCDPPVELSTEPSAASTIRKMSSSTAGSTPTGVWLGVKSVAGAARTAVLARSARAVRSLSWLLGSPPASSTNTPPLKQPTTASTTSRPKRVIRARMDTATPAARSRHRVRCAAAVVRRPTPACRAGTRRRRRPRCWWPGCRRPTRRPVTAAG